MLLRTIVRVSYGTRLLPFLAGCDDPTLTLAQ